MESGAGSDASGLEANGRAASGRAEPDLIGTWVGKYRTLPDAVQIVNAGSRRYNPPSMVSSLLLKKARLVQEVAGKLSGSLDPEYRDALVKCLTRLDILSVRYLGANDYEITVVPQEVARVSEVARPFGWAVWLSILTDARLDDPDWILGGVLKGSGGWGFSPAEARQWRSEYIRAHLAASPDHAGSSPPRPALQNAP